MTALGSALLRRSGALSNSRLGPEALHRKHRGGYKQNQHQQLSDAEWRFLLRGGQGSQCRHFLEQLHNDRLPHLMLVDVLLSGKDGRAIVKHLKSQPETMHIPVIMFSAHPNVQETVLQAGAEDFVAKPFVIDELLAKIAHFLQLE